MKKALTTLELLIALIIIGIIIAIAFPKFKEIQMAAKTAKANKELSTLVAALETYKTFNKSYPPSTTSLQEDYLMGMTPSMLLKIMQDPFADPAGAEYNYLCSSNGQYYVIWSVGLGAQSKPTAISDGGLITYST